MAKQSSAAIIKALQAELAALRATMAQDAPKVVHAPLAVREWCKQMTGPPSAFMAYVESKRGERAEPIADDPEAEALDQAAEKLAAMHPIDRQAYLEELRAKGRREDLIAARLASGLEPYTDEELEEMVRGD